MSWVEEDQMAMIPDSKEPIWKIIPLSPAEKSLERRTGKFKLLEDGTLEGDGRVEFTGHQGFRHKMINRGDSDSDQEARLKSWIHANIFGTAEIENFTIENVNHPEKPFVYTFRIRVPGYAQKTGRRIFFQPSVFERSAQPRFTASTRRYDVYIPYPYAEEDDFTLELPPGFQLENAESPGNVKDQQGIGSHVTLMRVLPDGRTLNYTRKFSFGNGGYIRFPAASYSAIKGLFEAFNKADSHQLTLRATETAGSVPGN